MAAIKSLQVVLTANATQLTAGLRAASAQLTAFGRSITTAASTTGRLANAAAGTSASVVRLGPAAGSAATSVARLGEASKLAATTVARLGTASGTAATNLTRLAAAANTGAGALGRLNGTTTAAAASQARLGTASAAAAAGTSRLGTAGAAGAAASSRLGAASAGAAAGTARLGASSASTSTVVSRLGASAGLAGTEAGRMGRAAGQGAGALTVLGRNAQTAATGGVFVLGVALAAAVAGAVKFEAQMRNVASIDKNVENSFAATSQAVLDMSKTVPQSAKTLADGLYNIAGSGFYGADAMHILDVSARAASAGMTTTNTASKAIVASLNAYGLGAESATRISDALFSAVNYGVISFEALTGAVANSVGNAAQAGVQIEELTSALATMTLSGMTASNAGVSLNNMISKLIKPSKALAATYKQLGINIVEDLKNPAVGLHSVMQELRKEGEGNLLVWLKWFPEIRAARGAMALAAAEGKNYSRVIDAMGTQQKTAGETARVFAIQAQSAQQQITILGNKIAVAGLELGMKMLPAVEKSVAGLTKFGGATRDVAAEVTGRLAPGFDAWSGAVRNVAGALDDMSVDELIGLAGKIGIGALVMGFNTLGSAVSSTTGFLGDHTIAVKAFVAAWLLFKSEAIIRGIQLIAVTIASTLVNGLVAGIAAIDAMIARLTLLGGGSLWRGLASGVLFYAATLGVATAGVGLLVAELKRVSDAKADIRNAKLSIDDILGQAPGGAANAVGQVADEIDKVGPKSQKSFSQARSELEGLRGKAQETLDTLEARNNQNFWDAGFWKSSLQFWRRTGKEADVAREAVGLFDDALAELGDREKLYNANLMALAVGHGLTTEAVARLANTYGLNLVQGLDQADASGKTLRQSFTQLATNIVGADASSAQLDATMKALDLAVGGADQAVKDFNTSLAVLIGNGLSASAAADAVQSAINGIADGSSLATTATGQFTFALTGNSNEAIKNRTAIREALEAASAHGEAVTRLTGDVGAGTAAFEEWKLKIIAAALAKGADKRELDALIASMSSVPQNVTTQVSVPGTAEALTQVAALKMELWALPTAKTINVTYAEKHIITESLQRNPMNALVLDPGAAANLQTPGNAAGGPIVGPGTGTSDSIPAMLSDGEWVIRERAAARYGPDAMAAVNAGRARIIVPQGYAGGGRVRPAPARTAAVAGSPGGGGSGTSGAIAQIASGAVTLADVYQQTTAGVVSAGRALRDVVPRMWRADQSSTSLAASTGAADGQMGTWLDTILRTTDGVDGHRDGLVGLARQVGGMTARELPGIIAATRTSMTATGAATTASRVWTAATDIARVAVAAATRGTSTHTEASRVLTSATGQQTAATRTQTTATGTQTTATNTARTATTAFSGVVRTASADLGTNAGAARNAAAAVRDYTAAVNSIPAQRTTTVTTNYVSTGTPAGRGYAGGGRIAGPGTPTSDDVPIMASRDEYMVRAAAAQKYGYRTMDAINAGTARVLVGAGAPAGYAAGGRIGHYAGGGMVRGSWAPVGGGSTVNISAPVSLTIQGGDTSGATIRAAERAAQQVVDKGFARLADKIVARPGRGRGRS